MRQVGAIERTYQDYKDIAAFFIVYIREAHAADSSWPVGYAKELDIKEHKTYGDRCTVATRLVREKKLTLPCLVDGIDNQVNEAYQGWPDRIFLVRTDGKVGVAAGQGPWGFAPGLEKTREWLAEYDKTGQEPAFLESKPDVAKEKAGEDEKTSTANPKP